MCSDVSGTTWKISCLSPEKMTISPHLPYFSTCPSQECDTLTHFKITFWKGTGIELSLHKVLFLTFSNLWFLGAFENYLFFIIVLTIISEKHHVIKQLPW